MGAAEPRLGIGPVLSATLGIIRRNLAALSLLGLVLGGLPSLLSQWTHLVTLVNEAAGTARAFPVLDWFAASIAQGVLTAAATTVVAADQQGGRAGFGAGIRAGLGCILPITGLSLLTNLGVAVGLALLVVPGVVVFLNWLLAVPVRVMEGLGPRRAMSRSAVLVSGSRWRCLALVVMVSVGPVAGLAIAEAVLLAFGYQEASVPALAAGAAFTTVFAVVYGVLTGVIYAQLRLLRDGEDPGRLAAVFS